MSPASASLWLTVVTAFVLTRVSAPDSKHASSRRATRVQKVLPGAKKPDRAGAASSVRGEYRLCVASQNSSQQRIRDTVERKLASEFRCILSFTPACANCVIRSTDSACSEVIQSLARGHMLSHSRSSSPQADFDCQNDLPSSDAGANSAAAAAASWHAPHPSFTKRDGAGLPM